jgi:cytoskeletal protein CcmA (bactofilin family)
MWKKGEPESEGGGTMADSHVAPNRIVDERTPKGQRGSATIGPSITIKGDVTGDEDLVIQGRIEGTVTLKKHNVVVGPEGNVRANVHGRSVTVEGEVAGDLHGQEQVVLRKTAKVEGNIKAPSVTLENGARFRGGIDMGEGVAAAPEPRKEPPKIQNLQSSTDVSTAIDTKK